MTLVCHCFQALSLDKVSKHMHVRMCTYSTCIGTLMHPYQYLFTCVSICIYVLKTISSNQHLNSKLTCYRLSQFSPFPYLLQWETCLSPAGNQFPFKSPPPPICMQKFSSPPQSTAATSRHRCPPHTAWPPGSTHGHCRHRLCLTPGCSPHLVLRLHDPWWVSLPAPTRRQPPPLSWALIHLARLCTCPLHYLEYQLNSPTKTGRLSFLNFRAYCKATLIKGVWLA